MVPHKISTKVWIPNTLSKKLSLLLIIRRFSLHILLLPEERKKVWTQVCILPKTKLSLMGSLSNQPGLQRQRQHWWIWQQQCRQRWWLNQQRQRQRQWRQWCGLWCCSDPGSHPICGQWQAGRQQWFWGNRHAVKIGSPIKLKPKTLILRHLRRY